MQRFMARQVADFSTDQILGLQQGSRQSFAQQDTCDIAALGLGLAFA